MLLAGKPLIAHSIGQAKQAGVFSLIAVSSDDDAILDTGMKAGADLLIKRPPELATDEASSLDVIIHAVKQTGKEFDTIVLLQPTSPLRLPEDIKKALEIFAQKPVASLVSVVKVKNLLIDGKICDEYQVNGSIYIWDSKKFFAEPKIIYPDTRLMEMPAARSVDIDCKHDFLLAEAIMREGAL